MRPTMTILVPSLCCSAHVRYIAISLPRIDYLVAELTRQVCAAGIAVGPGDPHGPPAGQDRAERPATAAAPRPPVPCRGQVDRKAVGLADQGNAASTVVKKAAPV